MLVPAGAMQYRIHCGRREGHSGMKKAQVKKQIKELKQQLRTTSRAGNYRLLKLFLILTIVAVVAAVLYGKIPI